MITVAHAMYAKYVVFVVKTAIAALALVAAPGFSTQAGHGTAAPHATPAHAADSHPTDSHATPAATPAEHAADPHATPAAMPVEHAADPHATPATHGEPAHDDAAHSEPAHGEPAHGGSHDTVAKGAHGGEHAAPAPFGHDVWGVPSGVWHTINFVLLFGGIFWLTRKALVAAARTKRDATAKGIEEATKLRNEMQKKFEDYDARMKTIDDRMNAIVAEAKSEAESEKARLVSEAGTLGTRIREDAKLIADQEIARAKRELQDEQIARAGELAEQILRTTVTKEDQARLADEFMSRVGKDKEGRA